MTDWYEQTFGTCPHGGIKPYCAQCVGDERKAKLAQEESRKNEQSESDRLRRIVASQSQALDDASRYIEALKRRLRNRQADPRPKTRRNR